MQNKYARAEGNRGVIDKMESFRGKLQRSGEVALAYILETIGEVVMKTLRNDDSHSQAS